MCNYSIRKKQHSNINQKGGNNAHMVIYVSKSHNQHCTEKIILTDKSCKNIVNTSGYLFEIYPKGRQPPACVPTLAHGYHFSGKRTASENFEKTQFINNEENINPTSLFEMHIIVIRHIKVPCFAYVRLCNHYLA